MKVYVACGGTGGHIIPGLATAQELSRRGHEVSLWLAGCNVEGASIQHWGGSVISLPAVKLSKSPFMPFRLMKVIYQARRIIKKSPPDVVLAMGSYTSFAPVIAAKLCSIPVVLHEANAIPGKAIAALSRFATAIGITFPEAAQYLDSDKVQLTGLPLRSELSQLTQKTTSVPTLLIMGGSQGAHILNQTLPPTIKQLQDDGIALQVIHLAGVRDAASVEQRYQELGVSAEVHAFTSNMKAIYTQTDFAIARAGAATCTELARCAVPALLIPLPHALRNHQMLNAMSLTKSGGVAVQPESIFNSEWLAKYLKNLFADPAKIEEMRKKQSEHPLGRIDGTKLLANLIEEVADN